MQELTTYGSALPHLVVIGGLLLMLLGSGLFIWIWTAERARITLPSKMLRKLFQRSTRKSGCRSHASSTQGGDFTPTGSLTMPSSLIPGVVWPVPSNKPSDLGVYVPIELVPQISPASCGSSAPSTESENQSQSEQSTGQRTEYGLTTSDASYLEDPFLAKHYPSLAKAVALASAKPQEPSEEQ
jgi:hypothetical protein